MHRIQENRRLLLGILVSTLLVSTRARGDVRRDELLKALPSRDREVIRVLETSGARVIVRQIKTKSGKKSADNEIIHRVHVIIGVKWSGGKKELKHLEEISTLDTVYFVGKQRISDKALREIQESLPDVIVKRRARFMLGIAVDPDPAGLRIGVVERDSPASKAGLHEDDVLLSVAGKPVKTFEELTDVLIDLEPVTMVDLKLERNKEVLDVTVELTEWE